MKKDVYGLSKPQESIWLTEQYFKNTNINRIICFGDFSTKIDNLNFDYLKKAINTMIKSNDTFQLRFFIDNGVPKQYLTDFREFDIPICEISSISDFIEEYSNRENVFNLIESPLYDFEIFRLKGTNTGGVIGSYHHIICDAITTALQIRQISECYNSLVENGSLAKLNPDNFSYIDYLNSEKEYINSDKFIKDKEYWTKVFETVPEVATIYSDKSSNGSLSCKAERTIFALDIDLMTKVNNLCQELKLSAYNFFMAVFGIYISKVSGLNDFVIGTPILNRTNFKEKSTLGMFISNIPFRMTLNNDISFRSFAETVAKESLSMLRHQKYSYGYILEDLRKKDSSLPNLYEIMLSYQVNKASDNSSNYTTDWLFNHCTSNDLDIHIFDFNSEDVLRIAYDYNLNKYSKEDIDLMHPRILHIINQILENKDILLQNIDIVTPNEKNKLLYEFNNTFIDYPKDNSIVSLFEEIASKNPNKIALVSNGTKLTYKELNELANKLAYKLINSGVKGNSIVGIMLNRSPEMIIRTFSYFKKWRNLSSY